MNKKRNKKRGTGIRLVIPFFIVLGVLTAVSFIIPLRPTQSMMEKRDLARFPEFTWEALVSGSYFDDITTWFSDTFPGREDWLALSSDISALHGNADVAISGDLSVLETVPDLTPTQESSEEASEPAAEDTAPVSEDPTEAATEAPTETTEAAWGGVDAANEVIELGAVIQIGDAAFNAVRFDKNCSDQYAQGLSKFADEMAELGIRVISAPAPTSVGVLVEKEYLEKLNCADQNGIIQYMHENMGENVIKVDTFASLVAHNSEYIYFRTDHHWTALGAYYGYRAICESAGMEPAALESFEAWDQGEFVGTLYWEAPNSRRLTPDNVVAYVPPGEISMRIFQKATGVGYEADVIKDTTTLDRGSRYTAFIHGDNRMTRIVNDSIPDAPDCILVKDSFGNCLAPFLTQNYHTVYVIDYRMFSGETLKTFMEDHEADDIIFAPYISATQSYEGVKMLLNRCA